MTEPDDAASPAAPPTPGRFAGHKARLLAQRERATAELAARRERHVLVELAIKLYERDRDAFGSVLGSAIAMRLFLFTASLSVAAVGLVNLITRGDGMGGVMTSAGITGQVASQVESAASGSPGRHITLLLTGLFLSASAGRSLTGVLAATSARAWGMEARGPRPPCAPRRGSRRWWRCSCWRRPCSTGCGHRSAWRSGPRRSPPTRWASAWGGSSSASPCPARRAIPGRSSRAPPSSGWP
ncbi:MAG: hypothetical protein KF703_02805 [Actinobacteria bacterium]|nr:hypothetical protein [Actinomycetota bacterium]